ncbi:DUF4214 domain-containing protein [Reyranella sp.]|jgi:hypothetical protein|uniref:DUF4214 domain-containing protein n=1 Tax=Reyranella sp. TaxID=1929291 RepID=UPI000BDCA166|nr:DUF4214 domain-containing protein [Reyranella sp.]OYY36811.1 MAG: hypothetical protein B7Y57_24230 [Rhodospirillales bacterium 35-66-84]OYZ91668.1 MAG: hypothetical protein B7Y08_24545 [Rhodospirillales bacterium 24-66-33]OZB22715.1 MAG: hypothetical protein B7X63_21695 [Rhodospirillales bacterium 39-66-50]HQS18248.1 DUF4214 domain-containing protein [Reyranella sp.]HQT09913.1 DUF4214 domain-containing protein [Reyranella sp.]
MAATKAQIAALYVGYFNRGADPEGLNYWLSQTQMSVVEIANSFAVQPEAKATYAFLATPNLQSIPAIDQFVTEVYQNVFERAPDQAGLEFWRNEILNGKPPGRVVVDIESGAQGDDKIILDRKTEVSAYYADKFALSGDTPWTVEKDLGNAADALDGDRAFWLSANAVTDAKAHVDVLVAESFDTVFELTTGVDNYTGGPGINVFNAALAVGIDGLVAVQTLQGADTLTGGGLEDTLNAELNNTGTTQNPTITDIEVYNLTSFAGPIFGSGNLDLDRASGYEQLWNRDSRADLTLINVRGVDADGNAPILGMDNVRDSTYNIDYDTLEIENQLVVADRVGTEFSQVELDIDGVVGNIGTLELNVSNGVYLFLDDEAADIENLILAGSGILELEGEDDFVNLETLNAADYTGDLDLDVGGAEFLTSAITGIGDDRIEINHAAFTDRGDAGTVGDLSVDLGGGVNILAIDSGGWWDLDSSDITGLNFTGGVANVQTLAFDDDVRLDGDATLDLSGFDADLTTIAFDQELDGNGNMLTLADAPVDLVMHAEGSIDWLDLNTGNVVNLDIIVDGSELDIDALIGPDDPLTPGSEAVLQTLDLVQTLAGGDIYLDVFGTDHVEALEELSANGAGDVDIELDDTATGKGMDALRNVSVIAANSAELVISGKTGTVFEAGVNQVDTLTIDVTAGASSGFPAYSRSVAGDAVFSSGDLDAGVVATNYQETIFGIPFIGPAPSPTSVLFDIAAADDIADDLDALSEINALNIGSTIFVEWQDFGPMSPLQQAPGTGATTGLLATPINFTTLIPGEEEVPMVPGEGFDGMQSITVDALDGDADVELTDVYGTFTLEVTASDNAWVDLNNTNAVSVVVSANHVDLDIGDEVTGTIGNWNLETATVSGVSAVVTLEDDLGDFTVLDASGVQDVVESDVSSLTLDVSEADYDLAAGEYVTYKIGAADTVTSDANAAREVFAFVGTDIGAVTIDDFNPGADPSTGDRLDLSSFGITGAGQLIFTDVGADLVITDLGADDFSGSITLLGLAGNTTDVATFNIIYA